MIFAILLLEGLCRILFHSHSKEAWDIKILFLALARKPMTFANSSPASFRDYQEFPLFSYSSIIVFDSAEIRGDPYSDPKSRQFHSSALHSSYYTEYLACQDFYW